MAKGRNIHKWLGLKISMIGVILGFLHFYAYADFGIKISLKLFWLWWFIVVIGAVIHYINFFKILGESRSSNDDRSSDNNGGT